jgi:hypothetical protein
LHIPTFFYENFHAWPMFYILKNQIPFLKSQAYNLAYIHFEWQ